MPCVSLAQDSLVELQQLVSSNPMEIEIDILSRKVLAEDHCYDLSLPDGARDSLLNGTYDPLDELLGNTHNIESTASSSSLLPNARHSIHFYRMDLIVVS